MTSRSSTTDESVFHSLTAYQILEENGDSDIQVKMQSSAKENIQFLLNALTSVCLPNISFSLVGSVAEGMLTSSCLSGKATDIDILNVQHFMRAIPTPESFVDDPSLCQFLIERNEHNPAYVKLRLLSAGTNPYNMIYLYNGTLVETENGTKYLSSSEIKIQSKMLSMGAFIFNLFATIENMESINISGPATSVNLQNCNLGIQNGFSIEKIDLVYSIPSPSWPDAATEWVTRRRYNMWPTSQLIEQIVSKGCYLVPKTRSESSTKTLNWLLSFSHAEPLLIFSMNDAMIKTYSFLKFLQKYVFHVEIGDVISSYIIKTALFWEVEETNITQWRPEHLFRRVKMCLKRVKGWFDAYFAPHYFIRNHSLLQRTLSPTLKQKAIICLGNTICTLEGLFQTIPPFVYSLRSRSMNGIIEDYLNTRRSLEIEIEEEAMKKIFYQILLCLHSFIIPFFIGAYFGHSSSSVCSSFESCRGSIYRLFKNHVANVPRLITLSTLLQKLLLLELIDRGIASSKNKELYHRKKLSKKISRLSKFTVPVLSLSNMLVSLMRYIYLRDYVKIEMTIYNTVQCLCNSRKMRFDYSDHKHTIQQVLPFLIHFIKYNEANNTDDESICIISEFPLTYIEMRFLPSILKLELECRFNVDSGTNPILISPHQNVLTVDAEVLFYFVSFSLFHSHGNIQKRVFVQKLERLCRCKSVMHLHIAFNLLGYCQLLMGDHRQALKSLYHSLCVQSRDRSLRTLSKATPYHISFLLHKHYSEEWSKTH